MIAKKKTSTTVATERDGAEHSKANWGIPSETYSEDSSFAPPSPIRTYDDMPSRNGTNLIGDGQATNNGNNGQGNNMTNATRLVEQGSTKHDNNGLLKHGRSKRPYIYTMHLLKKDDCIGLELAGGLRSRYGDMGVFVTAVLYGSNAEKDGRIRPTDELLYINGVMLKDLDIMGVKKLVQKSPHIVQLKLASKFEPREKSSSQTPCPLSTSVTNDTQAPSAFTYDLILRKDVNGRGLGFSVTDSYQFDTITSTGIFVKALFVSGAAERDGTLKKGDEIVAVNDGSLIGLPYSAAMIRIKNVEHGNVRLKVRRRKQAFERSMSSAVEPSSQLGEFRRYGSDHSYSTQRQPLYARNRKPSRHSPFNNDRYRTNSPPIASDHRSRMFQPIRPHHHAAAFTAGNRIQRQESTESCNSYDSSTSTESTRLERQSPIPRMGISAKHRIQMRNKAPIPALQRRSQSESDLHNLVFTSSRTRYGLEDSGSDDPDPVFPDNSGPFSLPHYAAVRSRGAPPVQDHATSQASRSLAYNINTAVSSREPYNNIAEQRSSSDTMNTEEIHSNPERGSSMKKMHVFTESELTGEMSSPRKHSDVDMNASLSPSSKCTRLNKPRSDFALPGPTSVHNNADASYADTDRAAPRAKQALNPAAAYFRPPFPLHSRGKYEYV